MSDIILPLDPDSNPEVWEKEQKKNAIQFPEYEFPFESFIGGWFIPHDVCDQLVDLYWKTTESDIHDGQIGKGRIDRSIKDSRDLSIHENSSNLGFHTYRNLLQKVTNKYLDRYTQAEPLGKIGFREGHNIKWYPKGGGYKDFHCERNFMDPVNLCRHLVYMTYLNDITGDGGETQFYFQKIDVKPQKGLTLIWPSDWTHTHRGNPAHDEEKMIITGWIHYAP